MEKIFFTPGPSQTYPGLSGYVQDALVRQIPSISHRSGTFREIYAHTTQVLRELLHVPDDAEILFFSSATEIWERLLQNYPGPGFFFVNGDFSARFRNFAEAMRSPVSSVEAPFGESFSMERVHIPEGTRLIGMIGNETSTGVWTPPENYYAVAERFPRPLSFVDMTSAFPTYRLDFEKVDGAYFSVQKGFGMPAGLGVLILGKRALDELEGGVGEYRGVHRDFRAMLEKSAKDQTVETPNVLAIYLLGRVVGQMLNRGEELYASAKEKAAVLYRFFDGSRWQPAVDTPRWRSETVVVLDTPDRASEIAERLAGKGLVVGQGYGSRKKDQLRIANFPAHSLDQIERLIQAFRNM